MGTNNFTLEVVDGDTSSRDGSTYRLVGRQRKRRNRYIYIGLFVATVVGLAIGLGLGLGLRHKDDDGNTNSAAKSQEIQQIGGFTGNTAPVSVATSIPPHSSSLTTTVPVTTVSPRTDVNKETTVASTIPGLTTQDTGTRTWIEQPCEMNKKSCPWQNRRTPPLLLVSLDGFRAEYLHRNMTPTIQRLRDCGVHTPYMRATYPTLTFPNHYTIVTGLYPESHGIVDNNMYDPVLNESFSLRGSVKYNPQWWAGEPIWTTAKKQGKKTASMFWVGSDVNISGIQPDIWRMYDGSVTFEERVNTVLKWLSMTEEQRPDLITLYFDEPDHTGHGSGPVSSQVDSMLTRVDRSISKLMEGLYSRDIHNCVNLVILADHGMEATSCDRKVELSSYIKTNEVLVYDGTIGRIHKNFHQKQVGKENVVVRNDEVMSQAALLKRLECKSGHYHAFSRQDIPVRHHYSNNQRIGDVVLDVQAKWTVSRKKSSFCLQGNHGYDNLYKSMQALFLAHGPGFKVNYTTKPFENIELYNMMSYLLDIRPSLNNGTTGSLDDMLRTPPTRPSAKPTLVKSCSATITSGPAMTICGCNNQNLSTGISTPLKSFSSVFGAPVTTHIELHICELKQEHFTTGYSKLFHTPAWSTYTLTSKQNVSLTDTTCVWMDSRVPNSSCDIYHDNITQAFLYNPDFDLTEKESRLHTNAVPMYTGFYTGIWRYMWTLISDYNKYSGEILVTTGPVYDYNSDRLWEGITNNTRFADVKETVAMPTHYYMILVRCSEPLINVSSCDVDQLDTMTFVLPHLNKEPNCLPDEEYLAQHVARIRDVELLTGLEFFSKLGVARSVRLRTHLATQVWAVKDLALHWSDLECSDQGTGQCTGKVPLLLISLDGFRADYIQRNITPVIHKMRQCGVHTPYMRATFPTVTFPNHYTIVTGLYPESHGIISNKMYDEHIGRYFTLGSYTKSDPRWWGGEPIWITAQKQNKTTATYFWPGSDVNISGIYPDYWKPYKSSAGYPERVSEVLNWLTLPEEQKPDMVTLYFDQPDHAGHQQGPEGDLVNERLRTMDMMVGRLMDGLYQRRLHGCVNIIIIADHGFDDTACTQIVDLSKHINTKQVLISSGTFGRIETKYSGPRKNITKNENPVNVSTLVEKLMCNTSVMKVFTKDTAPKRFHYLNNPRVGDILLDMADRWLVSTYNYYSGCSGGNHGWDNIFKSMHALFLAHGPAFQQNMTIGPFENIELYNLMSEMLDITPAPNNGTQGSLDHILVKQRIENQTSPQQAPLCQSGQVSSTTLCAQNQSSADSDLPLIDQKNKSVCQMNYPNQTTVYNTILKSPVYTTFTLTEEMVKGTNGRNLCIQEVLENVWNYQPHYPHFYTEIWNFTSSLIKQYVVQYGDLSVTLGPVYDHNGDGLADTNLTSLEAETPSHIFVVMMRCATRGQVYPCNGDVDSILVQALLLPYLNYTPNCLYPSDYLKDNIARVRDVELLTGLRFFAEDIFTVSKAARLRTHLSEKLWPSNSLRTWIESSCPTAEDTCTSGYQPLLLISLDGFRADYLLRNFTPYVGRLSQCGTRSPYMRSVYPTKTFPNHYSIVTGLYPESHGIVDNSMFDSGIDSLFKIGQGSSFDPRWWQGEPIWRTVRNNNKSAATFFWPGSDVKVNGTFPTYHKKYDSKVGFNTQVEQVLDWLTNEKPDFITLYLNEPDKSGHTYGPDNIVKIGLALERVDAAIGQLMEGLFHRDLHNCVNILLIADHGMSSISCDRLVLMKDYLSSTTLSKMHLFEGAFGRINNLYSQKSSRSKMRLVPDPVPVSDIMSNLTCHPHFKVFSKTSIPKRHHYANNPRIDDIIIDVENEWLVTENVPKSSTEAKCTGGNHGYDNTYKSMQALFLAHGPAFHQNLTVNPFENIELYNLMADVLGVRPAPNNGTKGSLNHVLKNPVSISRATPMQSYTTWRMGNVTEKFIQDSLRYRSQCLDKCNINTNTNQTKVNTEDYHIVFGRPSLLISHTQTSVYIKSYPSHVTAYSTALLAPLWVSYTQTSVPSPSTDYPTCILRGWDLPQCEATSFTQDSRQYTWTPLYKTAMAYSWESLISLNFVPMLENFRQGIWRSVQNLTDTYIKDYGEVNVMTGPIFDYNTDGHKDDPATVLRRNTTVSIPTHFFYIISRCSIQNLTACPSDQLKTLSFILPHTESITNCQTTEDYLEDNVARIKDIELLTDLEFYTKLSPLNSVSLQTFLPQGLWRRYG